MIKEIRKQFMSPSPISQTLEPQPPPVLGTSATPIGLKLLTPINHYSLECFFFAPTSLYLRDSYFDLYSTNYGTIVTILLIVTLLCFLLFIISYFFSFANRQEYEKISEYECGFEPFDSAPRQPYDVHFYMVGILFLIFDVEIALLFPWVVHFSLITNTGFWSTILFLGILTLGFVYEWARGALSWPHPTLQA